MKDVVKIYQGFEIVSSMNKDGFSSSIAYLNDEPIFGTHSSDIDKLTSHEKMLVKVREYNRRCTVLK